MCPRAMVCKTDCGGRVGDVADFFGKFGGLNGEAEGFRTQTRRWSEMRDP